MKVDLAIRELEIEEHKIAVKRIAAQKDGTGNEYLN